MIRYICISIFTHIYLCYIYYFAGVLTKGERKEATDVSDTVNGDLNNLLKGDSKLKYYLAGLYEGDGHIWMPTSSLKKKHNPRFCIFFNLKDEPLAKKILETVGFGHIRYITKSKTCVLIVSEVKGLKKIISLINGELRTPKIHELHSLID